MKSGIAWMIAVGLTLGGAKASRAEEVLPPKAARPAVRTTIELLDGSRIVGVAGIAALPMTLEFAKVDVPLHLLASCQLHPKDSSAVLTFTNGDRLTGHLDLEDLPLDASVGKLSLKPDQISRMSFSTLRAGPMPPGNAGAAFGRTTWQTWRTAFEVRGDRFVSLPAAREGFRYGHEGHGRGPFLATNVGSREWRDYRVDVRFCVPGVDPAFNPYGLGADFHSGGILFHVADAKESHNDRGLSAYCFGIDGDGSWRLEAVVNAFCDQPVGFGNARDDARRKLAEGRGIRVDRDAGNRYSISVSRHRIRISVDDVQLLDLVDERMDEEVGGQRLDHGGVAFVGGFDAMIWIEDFSAVAL